MIVSNPWNRVAVALTCLASHVSALTNDHDVLRIFIACTHAESALHPTFILSTSQHTTLGQHALP